MSQKAFSRYASFIQEYIYQKGWTDLRQVQSEACSAILDTNGHVIIASGTASGKTEAAFFPILTKLQEREGCSVSILYIGPLKALINDQFDRLDELLESQEIPVFPWHGDVSSSVKKRAMRVQEGVVQITPESLEALLMKHSDVAAQMFSDLQFVVIDELHAFMGTDRGEQLRALLTRLQILTGQTPRRIGLSATLADYKPAMDWISAGTSLSCVAAGIDTSARTVGLGMESYVDPDDPDDDQGSAAVYTAMVKKIYDLSHNKKCIVFTNSRKKAEEMAASLKRIADIKHESDVFYVHHSSVAASYRKETERAMKEPGKPAVVCATNTLELGIDVGDLDLTIQYGAPFTVSSFVQRLGRSGRRTGKSMMFFVNRYYDNHENPYSRLPWQLLRSLAIILLYAEDKFIEPFEQKPKPFSLLAHQTISLLYEHGELLPQDLAREIFQIPAFRETITREEYLQLLRWMVQEEFLEQMETKTLIPGLQGEKLASFYTYYTVFETTSDWQVFYKDLIGTISDKPDLGECFVLNGKAWKVIRIFEKERKVSVEPSTSMDNVHFKGKGGNIHPKVVEKIREILCGTSYPPFLHQNSRDLLDKARLLARRSGMLEGTVFPLTYNNFIIAPWTGTKILETLGYLFQGSLARPLGIIEIEVTSYGLYVETSLSLDDFILAAHKVKLDPDDPGQVLRKQEAPILDAWDQLVAPELRKIAFLKNHLDIEGAQKVLQELSCTGNRYY